MSLFFSQASLYNPDLPIVKRPVITPRSNAGSKSICSHSPALCFPVQRNRSSRFGGKRIGFALSAEILAGVFGVDFEEVVEDDQQHGGAAEEDGEGVELGVGDHGCWLLRRWIWIVYPEQ